MRWIFIRSITVLAALFVLFAPAFAATVTLNGDTINYEYDDVANAAALVLFGAPTIVGDDVRFLPPSFRAESLDGVPLTDLTTANFVFDRIYSINGSDLVNISIIEFGDYEITNGDSVSADVLLTVASNVSGLDFTSNSAAFNASGDSAGLQTWLMQAVVNPSLAFSGAANDVALSLQNTLEATTNAAGERAWIQKKLSVVATTVPVPAAVWLFGSALGLLGWMRRKAS